MKIEKFVLVDPLDDSGNDDGIINELLMTSEEAQERNEARRSFGGYDTLLWIKANGLLEYSK